MEALSGLLFGLCFAAVLGGVVRLLSPGSGTARLLRLCTALFVLTTVLRPAGKLLQSLPTPDVRENAQSAAQAVQENARTAIEQTARRVLDAHALPQAGIYVQTQIADGEIRAAEFRITGVPAEQAQEIANEIYALTGETPVVEKDP